MHDIQRLAPDKEPNITIPRSMKITTIANSSNATLQKNKQIYLRFGSRKGCNPSMFTYEMASNLNNIAIH